MDHSFQMPPMPRQYGIEMAESLVEIKKLAQGAETQGKMLIEQNFVIICSIQNPGLAMGSDEFHTRLRAIRTAIYGTVFE